MAANINHYDVQWPKCGDGKHYFQNGIGAMIAAPVRRCNVIYGQSLIFMHAQTYLKQVIQVTSQ